MKNKPKCETLLPWLRSNLGSKSLAPMTGQDARALATAVMAVELYAYCDGAHQMHALAAFAQAVECMQESTRELAYHAIAHVLEWSDRRRIWFDAELEPISIRRTCAFEPGGTYNEAA